MRDKAKEAPLRTNLRCEAPPVGLDLLRLPDTDSLRFLRMAEVQKRTGLSRATIYRLIKEGFPSPICLGAQARGWIAGEVEAWMRQRIAATRGVEVAH